MLVFAQRFLKTIKYYLNQNLAGFQKRVIVLPPLARYVRVWAET